MTELAALGARGAVVVLWAGGGERVLTLGRTPGGEAVAPTTLFHAASAGKHVTACAVLGLAQEGRVDLNAPVGDALPGLPRGWAEITPRHLLHHTSGLPDYLMAAGAPAGPLGTAAFLALCGTLEPFAEPGECWSYSNTNYILLGLLAARCGGRPCGVQLEARLADAGAGSARAASPDWVQAANASQAVRENGDGDTLTREAIGDGDVAFDVLSALAWTRALAEGRVGPAELFAPAPLRSGAPAPYGCGLFLERLGEAELVHHAGHFDGFTAALVVNRDRQAGAFALCDGAPGHTRAIRGLAVRELEAFAPGSTPLSLTPRANDAPDVTRRVREQLLRGDAAPDPDAFAPWLRKALLAAPGRGALNMSAGGMPLRFDLVSEHPEPGRTMRRYRLTHPDRVEHVSVGLTPDARIDWMWPL